MLIPFSTGLTQGGLVPFTTAWKFPSATALNSARTFAWTNPANAYADDASTATTGSQSWAANNSSHQQNWTGFGFTTSDVPSGATLYGIEFEMEVIATGGAFTLFPYARIAVSYGDSDTKAIAVGTHTITAGGPTNLFNLDSYFGADDSDIRASTFGVTLMARENEASNPFTGEFEVNYIKCRIHGAA